MVWLFAFWQAALMGGRNWDYCNANSTPTGRTNQKRPVPCESLKSLIDQPFSFHSLSSLFPLLNHCFYSLTRISIIHFSNYLYLLLSTYISDGNNWIVPLDREGCQGSPPLCPCTSSRPHLQVSPTNRSPLYTTMDGKRRRNRVLIKLLTSISCIENVAPTQRQYTRKQAF